MPKVCFLILLAVTTITAGEAPTGPDTTLPTGLVMPHAFSSHMVLQRDLAVPIWGMAVPGEQVTVTFAGQSRSTTTATTGRWLLRLDPMPASAESRSLVIRTAATSITMEDVLVGDVWIGSGQSNMKWMVSESIRKNQQWKPGAQTYPLIRYRDSRPGPAWFKDPKERDLSEAQRTLPQSGAWYGFGGTTWTLVTPETIPSMSFIMFSFGLRLHEELKVPIGLGSCAVPGSGAGGWMTNGMIEAYPALPTLMETHQQHIVRLQAAWDAKAADAVAKGLPKLNVKSRPRLPGRPSADGRLYRGLMEQWTDYGIRGVVWDQGESGATHGLDLAQAMAVLMHGWRARWNQGDFPFIINQKPSGGGCAWDPKDPITCGADAFAPLPATVPDDGGEVETYLRIMNLPKVTMALSSDLGGGVHPGNKFGYGQRAAHAALATVYGKSLEYYGPVYASHAIEGASIRIRFTHVGKGLTPKHSDKIQGFPVAGADRIYHWAEARIDGDGVVVSSSQVAAPQTVRYAWSMTRPWANMFNADGLPAVPFRTDEF